MWYGVYFGEQNDTSTMNTNKKTKSEEKDHKQCCLYMTYNITEFIDDQNTLITNIKTQVWKAVFFYELVIFFVVKTHNNQFEIWRTSLLLSDCFCSTLF